MPSAHSIRRPLFLYAAIASAITATTIVTTSIVLWGETVREDRRATVAQAESALRSAGHPVDLTVASSPSVPGSADVAVALPPPLASIGVQRSLRSLVAVTVLVVLATALLNGWMASRLVLAPLQDLASRLDAPTDEVAASVDAPDEVNAIAIALRRSLRVARDERVLSERRAEDLAGMQVHLARADKLASVGRLAAGVAHEIGNPLAAVMGYLRVLEMDLPVAERKDVLDRSTRELTRIHTTIGKLLTYARAGATVSATHELMAIDPIVDDTLGLLRAHPALKGKRVEVASRAPEAQAYGDPDGVRQILANLLINAGHALDDHPDPRIEIRIDADTASVALRVSDNGNGVPAEAREQIFGPFYTTRPVGEGTGLGLAVARSLAEAMSGTLRLEEATAPGATFVLTLPRPPPKIVSPSDVLGQVDG